METKNNSVENRILYLDCLRIVAIFAMMVLHVSASNFYVCPVTTFEWQVFNIYDSLVRFCVPVMVMISGVFFLDTEKKFGIEKIYKHNILRIATAFVFWSFLYAFINPLERMLCGGGVSVEWKNVMLDFRTGHYHMWFLFMIVGLYIITPLCRQITANRKMEEYFILLFFIFCLCRNLLNITPLNETINSIMWNIHLYFVLGYAGYFILGHYLHNYQLNKTVIKWINIFAVISLLGTITLTSLHSLKAKEPVVDLYEYLLPNTCFVSTAIFIYFRNKLSLKTIKTKTASLLGKLSHLTFGMYLVHDFFNIIFQRLRLSTAAFNPIISIPVIAVCVFGCSMVVTYFISKIPVLNKFIM